jgi:Tol biopolymer transport system component
MRADYPNWSHDSSFVYFVKRIENEEDTVYRVSLNSRKPERVASLVGTPRVINEVYTQWVGLAPDGSPLLLRSADLRQIYLLSFTGW